MSDAEGPRRDDASPGSEELVAEVQEYLQRRYSVGGQAEPPEPPPDEPTPTPPKRGLSVPALVALLVAVGGIAAYLYLRREGPAPETVAAAPAARVESPTEGTASTEPRAESPAPVEQPAPVEESPGLPAGGEPVAAPVLADEDAGTPPPAPEAPPTVPEPPPVGSATVASEDDFVTCRGVARVDGRVVRPEGVTTEFRPGLVHLFARVRSPGTQTVEVQWIDTDGSVMRSHSVTLRRNVAPGFRIYFNKGFQRPGDYEARLLDSGGRVIARRAFTVGR